VRRVPISGGLAEYPLSLGGGRQRGGRRTGDDGGRHRPNGRHDHDRAHHHGAPDHHHDDLSPHDDEPPGDHPTVDQLLADQSSTDHEQASGNHHDRSSGSGHGGHSRRTAASARHGPTESRRHRLIRATDHPV
jgi:hypothetical protein